MSKLLACVDTSSYAAAVCDLAAWVAVRLDWSVDLLHVVQRKSAVTVRRDLSGAIGLGVKSELLEELTRIEEAQGKLAVESGRALLAACETRLRAGGMTNITPIHLHGGIVETIIERESEVDLVVMGKRGASSEFAVGHIGSKVERVLRSANKPLLMAPEQHTELTHAVIAYDGGKSAARAIDLARKSRLLDGLDIHLVMAGVDTQENRAQLDQAAQGLEQNGRKTSWSLEQGPAEHVIADCVADRPASMLIMGAYGHSPLRNLIVGSTTTSMIRAVPVPILLIKNNGVRPHY